MGMDVHGKNPKNKKGEYFRNNIWWWHPLWEYITYAFPDIASKVPHAHSNDGDGLEAKDSKILALKLKKNLKNGKVAEYAKERDEIIRLGKIEFLQKQKQKLMTEGKDVENLSEDNNYWPEWYAFSEENVKEFAEFLENCGGFSIW
jgi:hypothetical protein